MQIIVLGMHRSGTSTVTRLINMMGAHVGEEDELIGQNEENPKGFWERKDVIALNDQILHAHKASWNNLTHWTHLADKEVGFPNDELRAECDYIIAHLNKHQHWVIKDPRLCQTLPMWMTELQRPILVHVHRDPMEIAMSLHKRNGILLQHGLMLWQYSASAVLNLMQHHAVIHVHYKDVLEKPMETTQFLFDAIVKQHQANYDQEDAKHKILYGEDAPDEEAHLAEMAPEHALEMPRENDVLGFIEPSLYRSKADEIDSDQIMTVKQKALLEAIESQQAIESVQAIAPLAAELMQESQEKLRLKHINSQMQDNYTRSMTTIKEQEMRIKELWGDLNAANLNTERLQTIYDEQCRINAELRTQISILGSHSDELKKIKSSKLWRIRNLILRQTSPRE
ncbi:MAG: sulfotransferase [Rickettsiales bacterium]|nr:sulfotransferase [Rickettsiales bacterium]